LKQNIVERKNAWFYTLKACSTGMQKCRCLGFIFLYSRDFIFPEAYHFSMYSSFSQWKLNIGVLFIDDVVRLKRFRYKSLFSVTVCVVTIQSRADQICTVIAGFTSLYSAFFFYYLRLIFEFISIMGVSQILSSSSLSLSSSFSTPSFLLILLLYPSAETFKAI